MFALKKIVGLLLQPGVIVLVLLSYGFLQLTLAREGRKRGLGFLALGLIGFYLFTTQPLPNYLVQRLENRYQPITSITEFTDIQYIVVLAGGVRYNLDVPATSQLDEASALRVAEGIRLFHLLSGRPTLIMTGGKLPYVNKSSGELMVAFAQSLGVPADKLVAETQAIDTHSNATGVQTLVKDTPFLLVTSATHLPRAMRIFQLLGMRPIPAPADLRGGRDYSYKDYFPSGDCLTTMEAAWHEYLGLAYLSLWPRRAGK